ncbi:MAG: transglutaminase domain-containing protein, partial [Clostridia bacterium]|nr:transglutaminase domain-containing protein [Clostridia bacterium]
MKHTPFDFDSLSLLAVGLPESLKSLRYAGRFEEELAEIDRLLADDTHPVYEPILRARLELERILAAGVSYDFSVTWADMMEKFRADYPGFAEKDLFTLIDSGHADTLIGPEPLPAGYRFQVDAYDNLTDCCEGYLYELTHPGETYRPTMNALRHEAMAHMKKHGRMAVRFTLTESIAPKEDFVFPGKRFRAWLPFPAVTPEQSGIELLSSNRPVRTDDHPIRTAYAEFDMAPGEKLEIAFRFTNTATYHDLSDEAAREGFPDEVRPYLAEQYPHIRFTPYLTMLAKELTGGITNPLAKARAIYNYVTTHVRYSYMREYRWMDNLPEYPALNG